MLCHVIYLMHSTWSINSYIGKDINLSFYANILLIFLSAYLLTENAYSALLTYKLGSSSYFCTTVPALPLHLRTYCTDMSFVVMCHRVTLYRNFDLGHLGIGCMVGLHFVLWWHKQLTMEELKKTEIKYY